MLPVTHWAVPKTRINCNLLPKTSDNHVEAYSSESAGCLKKILQPVANPYCFKPPRSFSANRWSGFVIGWLTASILSTECCPGANAHQGALVLYFYLLLISWEIFVPSGCEAESDGEQILMLMVSFFCVHYSMIVSYSHGSGAGLPFSVSLAVPLIDSKNNDFNYM